jgi:hypothetical protein
MGALQINLRALEEDLSPYQFIQEQQREVLSISQRIEKVSVQNLFRRALLVGKYWRESFQLQSYSVSSLKILVLTTYLGLLALGFLASYSSVNLLVNGNFSSALTVDFANTITNSGALFACLTDIPVITLVALFLVLGDAPRKAKHQLLDESYDICIRERSLTPEMHEELYLLHISRLQSLGIVDFYLKPDPLSKTGAIHTALAPKLKKISEKIKHGVTWRALWKNYKKTFKRESCTRKLFKITIVPPLLGMQALSAFLALENGILLLYTPVGDLFSSNSSDQINEAFYLTQLGGLFAALTSFGVVTYLFHRLFLRTPYQAAREEIIRASFESQFEGIQDREMTIELFRIMAKILKA